MDIIDTVGDGVEQTDSQEECSQLKFPYGNVLPNEILEILLHFVDTQDLLKWRTVSQSWNQITSRCLNMKRHPIRFFNSGRECYQDHHRAIVKINNFLETMQNRKKGPFPFSHFKFYFCKNNDEYSTIWDTMLSQEIGSYMKSCSVHLEHFFEGNVAPVLKSILCHSPNLDTLCIYGQRSLTTSETLYFDSSLSVHSKLKHLILMPYSPDLRWIHTMADMDRPMRKRISVTELASCLAYFPGLVVMKSGFNVNLVSESDTEQFDKLVQKFDLLELHLKIQDSQLLRRMCTQPLTNLHSLFLEMKPRPDLKRELEEPFPWPFGPRQPEPLQEHGATLLSELIFKSLTALSPTLKKLKIKLYCVKYRIPVMLSLEELELEYSRKYEYFYEGEFLTGLLFEQRLYPAQFPSLKRIYIKCPGDSIDDDVPEWAIFENSIFETVEYLNVHNRGIPIPWNCFPNLKTSDCDLRNEYPKNMKILSIQQLDTDSAFSRRRSRSGYLLDCYTRLGLIGSKYYEGRQERYDY